MEQLAYERDPKCTRLECAVLERGVDAGRPFVVLTDTILYPEGGGQPADHGTLNGTPVVDVQRIDGTVRHFLSDPIDDADVLIELDWERRLDHMQQHTAQHLLTAVAHDRFGWATTAFHLGDTYSDIEVDTASLGAEDLRALEDAVAEEIRSARPITTRRVSRTEYDTMEVRSRGLPAGHTGSVRLVEIEGIDLNTCGGTHCSSTSELEALKLLGTESLRGGTRIYFVAGARLRSQLGAHHVRNAELRSLLGVADEELVSGVEGKLAQLKDAQRALRHAESELATAAAGGLVASGDAVLSGHFPDRTLPWLQEVVRTVQKAAPDRVVLLTAGESDGFFILAAGEECDFDVAARGRDVAALLDGRGGGSGLIFQGRAGAIQRRAEALAALTGPARSDGVGIEALDPHVT